MSARIVSPPHHKFQRRVWHENTGPVFRFMKSMKIRFYPYSPTSNYVTEFYKQVNTRQQHEHTEKGFQIELLLENYGYHATVEAEYRNGDKLSVDGESHTAEDILKVLMYKRLDLEEQFDWAETHTMLTLEEEALLFSTKEKKKKSKLSKKGGAKTSGAGGAIKGGKSKK